MSTIYVPVKLIEAFKKHSGFKSLGVAEKKVFDLLDGGKEVAFDVIKQYSADYRTRTTDISWHLDDSNYGINETIDLTDECIALALDGDSIDKIRKIGGFTNMIALFGFVDGHTTISLVGADKNNSSRIAPDYQNATVKGIETWPRIGVLGLKKDFDDVLNSRNA